MTFPSRSSLLLAGVLLSACVVFSPLAHAAQLAGARVESAWFVSVAFSGNVNLTALQSTSSYLVSSATDARYATGRRPIAAGRRSQLLQFPLYPNHSLVHTNGHWAYLHLPLPLESGHSYTVRVANVISSTSTIVVAFDDALMVNPNIKINHAGYPPSSSAKFVYLGGYLGSLGPLPLAYATTAFVCNARTHATVMAVPLSLRRAASYVYSSPTYAEAEHSGEDIYEGNFSALTATGIYYVRVPQLGRSYSFPITTSVWWHVTTNMQYALYLQRCGIAVTQPYSSICLHGQCHTQLMQHTTATNADAFIPAGSGLGVFRQAIGGWHDAADYDRRVYHIPVVSALLDLYQAMPAKFTDAQFLIPEAGNRIPDLLDHAWWGLRVWCDLQDADGGIFGGTERRGEGGMDEPADNPALDYYIFSKTMVNRDGTPLPHAAWFAAAAAQLARLILPWDAARAQTALLAARRAFDYSSLHDQNDAARAAAAAELFLLTGEQPFHDAFLACTTRDSFSYALSALPSINNTARTQCRTTIISQAGDSITFAEQKNGYRYSRNPYRKIRIGGGSGALRDMAPLYKAHRLTGSSAYLACLHHNINFILGCNPLGISWITAVGHVFPTAFTHRLRIIDGRTNLPPGYHVYGPYTKDNDADPVSTHYQTFWDELFPPGMSHPHLRKYVPSEWMAGMNEFTIGETLVPTFAVMAYAHFSDQPDPASQADTLPPGMLPLHPLPESSLEETMITMRVRVEDHSLLKDLWLNGVTASGSLFYARTVAVPEGTNWFEAVAMDVVGNTATCRWWAVCGVPEPCTFLAALTLALVPTFRIKR